MVTVSASSLGVCTLKSLYRSPVFGGDHTGSDPSCAPRGDRAFSLFYVSERSGNNNSPNWHDAIVIHWFHLVPGTQGGSEALNHPLGSWQLQADSTSSLPASSSSNCTHCLTWFYPCPGAALEEKTKQGFGVTQAWLWCQPTLLRSSGPVSKFPQPLWACFCVSEMELRWS